MAAPIEARHRGPMNDLARELDERFNGPKLPGVPRRPKFGFALLVFEFDEHQGGQLNYISNGTREDMLAAMKEFVARVEGRAVDGPQVRQ